ncbi:phosphatidylserine/phosphatidylglycerophosphate/cardiolipin synthase family protein [Sphingomonas sp. BN140010]|uniref:Phospholipase D n=1 Tax=Sphingomonas arvum TaxID=2992113 RepID=A0ABT3JFP2_9SPHN|nr:phosphatidylserine/phosphatidylglycerophosphate/cardiolipin synthase family protein [Sphingomonas sp. BN140010]MCW3797889.1 phosphatidylserine/phosphatidylglycerophosphate/cardiolipin synthase family protein [Sphingomonas sp. BN140010]
MDEDVPAPPTAPRIAATVAGTRLELLDRGTERLSALLELIDSATSSIRLLFYMMNPDAAGEAVADALVRAARRGVAVRLLLDGFGSSVTPAFFQPLADAGGSFILFHPHIGRRYLLRNHQKMVVVDETRALIGGANIDTHYLSDRGDGHWRDLWLLLDGAAVKAAARYFDAIYRWSAIPNGKIRSLRRIIQRHSQRKGALQWRFSGPMRRRNPWPTQIAKEIITGSRFDLIAAYFSPPFAMLRRIARMGRRGQVRIVTAARSDNDATIAAARHTYAKLLRNGVEMYEYQPAKLHTKLAIVDDVVHIGSSNFDFRSLYLNLEVMLRIDDAGFAAQMRGYFERELADSLRITPEVHKARAGLLRRLKWTISHWLVTGVDYTVTRRLNFGAEA